MPAITEEFVNTLAPNQSAISNGWGLVKKNSFVKLSQSADGDLLFGECKGSGASNYLVSVDFVKPDSPVSRCTCPSRQFPCKHALGLLYAYISGKTFDTADIPQDILEKRGKAEKREEKKKSVAKEPKKVNKSALKKKIAAQIEGLDILEKLVNGIVQSGLGTINKKTLDQLENQAKQLGNYYISEAQATLMEFVCLFRDADNYEEIYSLGIGILISLNTLCRKGKDYLRKRLEDPELAFDASSSMDEMLGHIWQLTDLKELGLVQNNIELVQLSFNTYISEAKQEYVDYGVWISLTDGVLKETLNFRPFKAAKYIREDDSFFSVMQVKELYSYPGSTNTRVRWENASVREITSDDFKRIKELAQKSFSEAVKSVKNLIKNPLEDKYPYALLGFSKIGQVEGTFVMEDAKGQRLVIEDNFDPSSTQLLGMIQKEALYDQAALVSFHPNPDTRKLTVQVFSIITDDRIIRLAY